MNKLIRKKLLMLAVLLVGVLVLAGCGDKFSNLTVKMVDEQGTVLSDVEGKVKLIPSKDQELSVKDINFKNGLIQFKELPIAKYKVEVTADGYKQKKGSQEIIVEEGNPIVKVTLIKLQEKIKEEIKKEEPKKITKVDLFLNISDGNQNKLKAKVILRQNDKVRGVKTGSKVTFTDLLPGQYEIEFSRKGYGNIVKKVTIGESNKEIPVTMVNGKVRQYLIDKDNNQKELIIEELDQDEEAIVAISYLNLNSSQPNFDLDKKIDRLAKIEYDVRKRGIELVKKYGADFAISEPKYSLGDIKEFQISNSVKNDNVNATLQAIGKHIYVFVDNKKEVEQDKIDTLVAEFDNKIYPTVTGKDNQGKVVVLLTDFDSPYVTGYFDAADLYADKGNEEAMFYLNADRKKNTLLTAAAHQYQHMSFFIAKAISNRTANDAWIDQGLAQLVPQLVDYINPEQEGWSSEKGNGWVYNDKYGYLNNTEKVSLLSHDGSLPFTGAASLYVNYLVDQYGIDIVKEIMTSSQNPVKVLEEYTGQKFAKLYTNWLTTNVTDNIADIDSKVYNYSSFNLQQMPSFSTGEVNDLGVSYFKINGQGEDVSLNPPKNLDSKVIMVIIRKKK